MRPILGALLAAALATAASAQSVTMSLSSPQAGSNVAPGATINWSISFSVSQGDNAGLALIVVDLTQNNANPAYLDIPPATAVPAPMTNFSRPAGICNPGETNPVTGFTGLQRGTPGRKNLLQIGGAQNTFGLARPSGSGSAENANVIGAVGQSGSVLLASGSFAAPATPGAYTFQLANPAANVLTAISAPPSFSPVTQATLSAPSGSFTFTVGGVVCPGDVDGDNDVDLSDLATLLSQFGSTGSGFSGDLDHDGDVDLSDLATLLANFGQVC